MLDLSWVAPQHAAQAAQLVPVIVEACEKAEKSTRFIAMQLNPKAEWRGWPTEVAEEWLAKRPSILLRYFDDTATTADVSEALRVTFKNEYRPRTGNSRGMPKREPMPGLNVPADVSKALDAVSWDVMRKFGGTIDRTGFVQAAKVPSIRDEEGGDTVAVLRSVGTVKGTARKARYMSISGNLYWSDVRNTLDLWIRARPELLTEFSTWDDANRPRAWQEGGKWVPRGNGRVEHNPLVLIRTSAYRTAAKAVSHWKQEGYISLDAVLDAAGEEGVAELRKPEPQRRQHKPKKDHAHYAWGLRDRVDCYDFPVTVS